MIDVPFENFRDQKWRDLEREDLQRVFEEAFGDRLSEHKLKVRVSFIRQGDGDKWFMSLWFVSESQHKSPLLREVDFFYEEDGQRVRLDWIPARPAGDRRARPHVMVLSYNKLDRIGSSLLFLRVDFGYEIEMVNTNRRRNPQAEPAI